MSVIPKTSPTLSPISDTSSSISSCVGESQLFQPQSVSYALRQLFDIFLRRGIQLFQPQSVSYALHQLFNVFLRRGI